MPHFAKLAIFVATLLHGAIAWAEGTGPSFDCAAAEPGSIEMLICADAPLSALDREMARIYKTALAVAEGGAKNYLRDDQRYWLTRREKCLDVQAASDCATGLYMERVLFLLFEFGDANADEEDRITSGPFAYACEDRSAFSITFFRTDPPLAYLREDERGYRMELGHSGSGARYEGEEAAFWGKGGEALVSVAGGPETSCTVSRD